MDNYEKSTSTPEYKIIVPKDNSGRRLDLFLFDFAKNKNLGLSRNNIKYLITNGLVILNEKIRPKAHYKVKENDRISISIKKKEKETELRPEKIPLEIIFEDDDLAIINKPHGLVVHPAPGNYEHTLVNAILYCFKQLSDINPLRPGIVHRLDKDTSGIIVIAKNNLSHLFLSEQFSLHSIKRKYVAVVSGRTEFDENVIEVSVGRHPFKRKSMSAGIGKKSRYAKTFYRTLKRSKHFSLLELEPFTGRTHQLRVHLNFINHPILGDTKYGRKNKFSRLALHAIYLGFIHPTKGKFVDFSVGIPQEFLKILEDD